MYQYLHFYCIALHGRLEATTPLLKGGRQLEPFAYAICQIIFAGSRTPGDPRAEPHSVLMPSTRVTLRATAKRALSPAALGPSVLRRFAQIF
ncbi:MAG: hypothetical protein A3H35_14520 [Betaproteobacteria bacterium RIFCSPLOWO2_02_FULL_62_17]|nr:MAG: hypothetical protein A3H35_14520 [Betaproteobacteria bacterium RIFCSPLOWO2_02_FULL_62_17]